jgi:hypothetical protein
VSLEDHHPSRTVSQSVYLYALQRAALLAGGAEPLARRLELPAFFVESWLRGLHPVPLEIFLMIVDLVLEDDMNTLRANARQNRSAHCRASGTSMQEGSAC